LKLPKNKGKSLVESPGKLVREKVFEARLTERFVVEED
jgi:hypothetical protein